MVIADSLGYWVAERGVIAGWSVAAAEEAIPVSRDWCRQAGSQTGLRKSKTRNNSPGRVSLASTAAVGLVTVVDAGSSAAFAPVASAGCAAESAVSGF